MNRREFLASVLAIGASPGSLRGDEGYIDAHSHVWSPDLARWPRGGANPRPEGLPLSFTPEDLLRHSRPCGVTRAVLIQMSFYAFDNRYLLTAIASRPGAFSGVGKVNPDSPTLREEVLGLFRGGVRGFRIQPFGRPKTWLDTAGMDALWRYAAENRMRICPLVEPDALPSIERMSRRHPDCLVVIDHLARVGADGTIRPEEVAALCRLARLPQVHVKVSAFYALGRKKAPYLDLQPLVRRVYDAYGPDRLMWGSDSPYQVSNGYRYADSVAFVRDHLPFLSPSDRECLLRTTAERVFFA